MKHNITFVEENCPGQDFFLAALDNKRFVGSIVKLSDEKYSGHNIYSAGFQVSDDLEDCKKQFIHEYLKVRNAK